MFKWLLEKRDLNFAKKGSIGGTADLHLNDDYWTGIFFKVIAKALQDQQIPSWVVKGDSLEEWDSVKVLNFFQESPR